MKACFLGGEQAFLLERKTGSRDSTQRECGGVIGIVRGTTVLKILTGEGMVI